ncbi:glycosyltransferase [Sphingobacterium spiritivorum]|uniref:glycosyltransferase n=1 Tax=Sphingobacterium spiritivorum TaxID=258 RepID=UPI001919584A|nr:glycosyltransferase [Sphingobacterium spiritivorum]QQT27082.1 glycosyltransferase family 4 protein [Sphingobacterium spiritivorum]
MSKKKVLYFMPDNPMDGKGGNLTRCNQMLQYFQSNSQVLEVHFVSTLYWDNVSMDKFKLIYPDIILHVFELRMSKQNIWKYLLEDKIPRKLNGIRNKGVLDNSTPYLKSKFKEIIQKNRYDIILISYSTWGNIIDYAEDAYKIIDTHDFMTLQYKTENEKEGYIKVGEIFQEEIDTLSKYDEIWTYSVEERYIFEQFTNSNVTLIPVSFPSKRLEPDRNIKYDMLYVASDNRHNIKSIKWFLKFVFPLLNNVKLYVVGKICSAIDDAPNIIKLGVVENLEEIYKFSKICICPMITGTGVKIKVLESLSYGLPVVTTKRGVDGLVNKSQNGCLITDDPEGFANYIKQLLSDQSFYAKISEQARLYFEENHNETQEIKLLNNIFLK